MVEARCERCLARRESLRKKIREVGQCVASDVIVDFAEPSNIGGSATLYRKDYDEGRLTFEACFRVEADGNVRDYIALVEGGRLDERRNTVHVAAVENVQTDRLPLVKHACPLDPHFVERLFRIKFDGIHVKTIILEGVLETVDGVSVRCRRFNLEPWDFERSEEDVSHVCPIWYDS